MLLPLFALHEPGTTEFGYEPGTIVRLMGPGQFAAENRHAAHAVSDVEASLDDLQGACPNLERVAIVVAWFGSDLRAQHFTLTPKVDSAIKQTFPESWSVAGLSRGTAPVVSTVDGRPAFGGTPSDESVTRLIEELLDFSRFELTRESERKEKEKQQTLQEVLTNAAN